jgi:hypothetical protein
MTPLIVRKAAGGKLQDCIEKSALEQRPDIADKLGAELIVLRKFLFENLGQAPLVYGELRWRASRPDA